MDVALIGSALVAVGGSAAVYSARRRSERRVKNLRQTLEIAYLEDDPKLTPSEVSSLLARAGVVAERTLARRGFFARVAAAIDRSDWNLSAGEFVAVSGVFALAGLGIGLLGGGPVFALLLAAAGGAAPYVAVNISIGRRRNKFESQFPDVLDLMAASLESGSSVSQAIELIVAEADEPAASEFGRVLSSTRLGAPLVDALRAMGERIGSRDLDWTVQAIVVQQRTGGRLADILRTVAEFMRAREEVRRELQALTAEGKLSAFVLGGLPFVVGAFIQISNPDYLTPLFTTTVGLVMTIGALALMGVGFFVMSRMIKIEV
jgi:tight adherence protein B